MNGRSRFAFALAVALAAAPALAGDDTLTGTLVSVDDDGRAFTIQSAEGKNHKFLAPSTVDLRALEPGANLQVTAQPITDVGRDESRQATAVAVLPADQGDEESGTGSPIPGDPSSGGAPGGGPPSGGIPGGGVPSGGSPSGGLPSGGGVTP
jgi:hypothetical protein